MNVQDNTIDMRALNDAEIDDVAGGKKMTEYSCTTRTLLDLGWLQFGVAECNGKVTGYWTNA